MALNPIFPPWYWEVLALAYYVQGSHEDALSVLGRNATPTFSGLAYKAVSEVALGHVAQARLTINLLQRSFPEITLAVYQRDGRRFAFRDEELQANFVAALRQAGLS